jgi:type II secretory pathway pseudopilin PulG
VTLVEVLVTMSIILVLTSAVLFGSRAVNASRNRGIAERQMALISTAIDQYASFWPRWEAGGVLIADEGWPDFIPGRLFATCNSTFGPYDELAGMFDQDNSVGFNNFVALPSSAWIDPTVGDGPIYVLNANTCLAFALTAGSGNGPFIKEKLGVELVEGEAVKGPKKRLLYPSFCALGPGAKTAEIFLDPWRTPLRYFWVYRDATRASYRGYLPVTYGAFTTGSGFGGVLNTGFEQQGAAVPQIAAGYVLESAGPDRKFGNVWKVNPAAIDIADADDNITIAP